MYLRGIKQKRKVGSGSKDKVYEYLQLVETHRTPQGPRQRLLLNLGPLPLEKKEYKGFVQELSVKLSGQTQWIRNRRKDSRISQLVNDVYERMMRKEAKPIVVGPEREMRMVDANSQECTANRSIGPEYVGHKFWERLGLSEWLKEEGISGSTAALIEALVIGRLLEPGSERMTQEWLEKRSGLFDLLERDKFPSSMNYYRAGDCLFSVQNRLEDYLRKKEATLFELSEKIIFYDLTNTYFEGTAWANPKAKYGRSKEKRRDCKLLTLGLVLDSQGFAKQSRLFSGSVSEGDTLEEMIEGLSISKDSIKPTVVMDAGIATKTNIQWLKENGYSYIVCHRGKPPLEFKSETEFEIIQSLSEKKTQIEVTRHEKDADIYLKCHSEKREHKETGMRTLQEKRFLDQLIYYRTGLNKPKRVKNYQRLIEMIGRLKERFSQIAKLYDITVVPESEKKASDPTLRAIALNWEKKSDCYQENLDNEGTYILRTNRKDLTNAEIWNSYIALGRVEHAFRNMKSHLGFRPIFHQKENRSDAHLFISVLAYHLLHSIEHTLRLQNDHRTWWTIKKILSTHQSFTLTYEELDQSQNWVKHHIRTTSVPDDEQKQIYSRLNLPHTPFKKRVMTYKK